MKKGLIPEKVRNYKVYVPGKPIEELQREKGLDKIVKMASNENPNGPSPLAVEAMRKALEKSNYYPDSSSYYLRKKLSNMLGFPEDNFLVGPGTALIIKWLAKALLEEGDNAITSEKTFLMYTVAVEQSEGILKKIPMREDLSYNLEEILSAIDEQTKLIFIANPNNPTGTMIRKKEMDEFIEKVPKDVIVVLDEAYREYVDREDYPEAVDYIKQGKKNVVALRTFSKIYGLAGLRIGYAITIHEEIIDAYYRVAPPFPVTSLAQVAAIAALDDKEFLRKSFEINQEGKKFLYREFDRLGIKYVKTQTNFIYFIPPLPPQELKTRLEDKGIIIRYLKAFEAPEALRVTIGRPEENEYFIKCLEEILKEEGIEREVSGNSH